MEEMKWKKKEGRKEGEKEGQPRKTWPENLSREDEAGHWRPG
jgi:hypothetical protein